MNELEKILAEGTPEPKPASEEKPKGEPSVEKKDDEVARKEEQLANLNKAIAQANEALRTTRKQIKKPADDDDDLPKINMEDPSARAWDKHISEKVNPALSELDKEKEEVRTFALREFLKEKPALARNPEKVKELIENYELLSKGRISERTKEGVTLYLNKAYAATFDDQLVNAARQSRIEKAESDILLSDIAVSRGASSYSDETPKPRLETLTAEEQELAIKFYGSVEKYQEERQKYPR